jgi:hypothetical protein
LNKSSEELEQALLETITTPNQRFTIRMRAIPLPVEIVEYLESNESLMRSVFNAGDKAQCKESEQFMLLQQQLLDKFIKAKWTKYFDQYGEPNSNLSQPTIS